MRVKSSDLLLAVPLTLTLLISAPHHLRAAEEYEAPDVEQEEKSACNAKQQDLIKKANKNMRMPDKVDKTTGSDQTRQQTGQAMGNFIGSNMGSFPIFSVAQTAMGGAVGNVMKMFMPGANGQAPQDQLVRQNDESCNTKKRAPNVPQHQDPRDAVSGSPQADSPDH